MAQETKAVQDVIETLKIHGADTVQAMRDVLCDGAALKEIGFTDSDQEAIEAAYNSLR